MSGKSDVAMEVMDSPEAKSLNSNDVDMKDNGKNKKSTLDHLLQLLSDSVVTGIPQIVTVGSLLRKIFKILVLGACIGGFIYQAVEFMKLYNTYPSSLEIEVKYKESLPEPAVTICNTNSVKRTEFCKAKKEFCAKPTNRTRFCNMYPHHCNENTTVDDLEFVISDEFIDRIDVETYGHGRDLIDECCYLFFPARDECRAESKKTILLDENKVGKKCYTVNFKNLGGVVAQYTDLNEAFDVGKNRCLLWSNAVLEQSYLIMVNLDPNEVTRPDKKPSAQAAVHSQNYLADPFLRGFTMEEGKQYTVTMKAFEEYLLPAPYSTNCTENEKLDENYDREVCMFLCELEVMRTECGCVPLGILTTAKPVPVCTTEEIVKCSGAIGSIERCSIECPRACKSSYFEYRISSSDIENTIKPVDLGDGPVPINKEHLDEDEISYIEVKTRTSTKGKALLKLVYSSKETTIFKYKPKYEKIEILGYIGGFSGIWLGVSLVAVLDFFETIIVFLVYVFKRAKGKKKHGRK